MMQSGDAGVTNAIRRIASTAERSNIKVIVDADIAGAWPRIRKVPERFRTLEGSAERLFTPRNVAIGPYHHGANDLREAEEFKRAALHEFCVNSNHPVDDLYHAIQAVAGEARGCYDRPYGDISDEDFTEMMLVDGCFLLAMIATSVNIGYSSSLPWRKYNFLSDILLVENQLPLQVLEAIMTVQHVAIEQFVEKLIVNLDIHVERPRDSNKQGHGNRTYRPLHFLDLVRERLLGPGPELPEDWYTRESSLFSSAVQLEEAGIHVSASGTARLRDISIGRRLLLFGRLSLPRVKLTEFTKTTFLNMAAFEAMYMHVPWIDCGVCSYLAILGQLVSREDDVKELRLKGVLFSTLTDRQTLDFVKLTASQLPVGRAYRLVTSGLNDYHRKSGVLVTVHRFVYRNFKFLFAVGSLISISVSILKAVMSLHND